MKVNIFYRKCLGSFICSSLLLLILGCSGDTGVPIFSKLPSDLVNTIRPIAFFYGAKVTGAKANDQTCADALSKNINLINDGFKPTNTLAFTSKQKYNLSDIFISKTGLDIADQTKAEVYYYSNINTNNPVRVLLDFKADELVKFNTLNGEFTSTKVQLFFKSLLSKDTYDEGDFFTFTSPNGAYDVNDNCSDGSSDSVLKLGIIGFTSRDYENDNLATIRKNVLTPASQNCSLKASLFCVATIEKNTTFNPTQLAINTVSAFTLKSNTIDGLLNNLTLSDEFSQKYDNNFPSIIWTSAPSNTKSLALTITQDSNIHLVLYNIPFTPNFTIPKLLGYNPDFTTVWNSGLTIGKNSFPGINGGYGWAGTTLSQTPYKFTLYTFENQKLQVDPDEINIANFEKKEAPYNFISKAYFIGITPKTFSLISKSTDKGFDQGGLIPLQFNSNQQNNFPKISWINAPTDASSFVLIVSDSSGKTNFILYDIPKNLVTLDWLAGSNASGANFPSSYGRVGTNAYGVNGWTGFKTGESYTFRLFAMRTTTTNSPSSEDLQSFVSTYGKGPSGNNTIIASAVLNGSATSLPLKLYSTYATRGASILGFTPNGNLDISFNQEKAGGLNNFPKLSWDDGPSSSKIKSYLLYITSQNKTLGLTYNINPSTKYLDFTLGPEPENSLCVDCSWSTNSFGKTGWSGPDEAGVIEFTLIALDKKFISNEVNSPNQFKSGGEFYKYILNKDLDIAKTQANASAPYKLNSNLSIYGGGFTPSITTTNSATIIEGIIPLEFNKNTSIKEQKNNFPALFWENPPISTSSYVLIITNKENDSANLILSNIPSSLSRISKQTSPVDLRTFGKVTQNSFMQDWTGFEPGYTYKFTLYSLNVQSITGALPALNLSNYNNITFRQTYSSIIRSQASIEAKASVPPLYAWSSLADFGFDSSPPTTTIQEIPLEFSQILIGGGNNFPKISWQGGNPVVIKSYVLAVTNNDKTNLLLYNIPTNINNLPRILGPNPNFKNICNSCEAVINSFGVTGWSGPNDINNYIFKIYALDTNDYSNLAINSVSQFEKGGNYFSNVKYTASFTGRGSPPFVLTSDLNRNGFDPTNGVAIPNRFQKIDGHTSQKNDFPFLSWTNPPNPPTTPTRSYAIIINDKDNDLANALISNIPFTRGITPVTTITGVPGPNPERNPTFINNCPTCIWATNSYNNAGWTGFAPEKNYRIRLYALSTTTLSPTLDLTTYKYSSFEKAYSNLINGSTFIDVTTGGLPLLLWSSVENGGFSTSAASVMPHLFSSQSLGGLNFFPFISWIGGSSLIKSYVLTVSSNTGNTHLLLYNIPLIKKIDQLSFESNSNFDFGCNGNSCGLTVSNSFKKVWSGPELNQTVTFKLYGLNTSLPTIQVKSINQFESGGDFNNPSSNLVVMESPPISIAAPSPFTLNSMPGIAFHGGGFIKWDSLNNATMPIEFNSDTSIKDQFNNFPALEWSKNVIGAKSYALIINDITNTNNIQTNFLLSNIPGNVNFINKQNNTVNWATIGTVTSNTQNNNWIGFTAGHLYNFRIYALNVTNLVPPLNLSNSNETDFLNTYGKTANRNILAYTSILGKASSAPLNLWSSVGVGGGSGGENTGFNSNPPNVLSPIPSQFNSIGFGGINSFPKINWNGGPTNVQSYVLSVISGNGANTKTHLMLYNIPSNYNSLPKIPGPVPNFNAICNTCIWASTSFNTEAWYGANTNSPYSFKLYALSTSNYNSTPVITYDRSKFEKDYKNEILESKEVQVQRNNNFTLSSTVLGLFNASQNRNSNLIPLEFNNDLTYNTQQNNFPNLSWSNVPSGTESFVLIVTNKDNKKSHLILYDINKSTFTIPNVLGGLENWATVGKVALNSYNKMGWTGFESNNNYKFSLYALTLSTIPATINLSNITDDTDFINTFGNNNVNAILGLAQVEGKSSTTPLTIWSSASSGGFDPNMPIPLEFSQVGNNYFPSISWGGGANALSYILYVNRDGNNKNHLILHSIPAELKGRNKGIPKLTFTNANSNFSNGCGAYTCGVPVNPNIDYSTSNDGWAGPLDDSATYTFTLFALSTNNYSTNIPSTPLAFENSSYKSNILNKANLNVSGATQSPLPANPTLLVASINSLKQIELRWQTSRKATFYNIYRSLTSPVSTLTVLSVSSINSYIDKNVVSGGKYFYVVKAGNSLALSSGTSNEVSVTLAPSEATNLVAILNNLGNVSLSWVGANGATSYKIFKSTNNIINTNRLANFTTTAPNTSFTDTTAVSGTNYFYTILSNNVGGDATLTSNTISITPQNLVPIITTITAVNTLVTINWTSSYGAQSYNLYRATTNPFIAGVANLLISSITQTSISTDNTTLNNSLYYYVVTAVDASANISLQSNWASIQIVPDQATMLISSVTQTEVYLDWVVPARGASSYVIYRDTSNLVSRASGTQFTTSNNKFIDTSAMQGVNYFYIVYSKNDSGFSINPTNIIQASLSAPQVAPSPLIDDPTLLVASINSLKQVELSWQTSRKATYYNIYRSLSSPVSTITVLSVSSINSYIDKNVVSGGKYFYVVKAGNSLALSTGTSNEVSITLAPSEATNLVASLNNVGNVSLSWIGANGATSYKIFKSTNNIINTNRPSDFTTTAPNTSFTDTTAVSGTNYFYTILSNNAGGDATLTSNTISITPQNLVPIITTITAVNTLVTINWTSSYGAQSYNLYRATTNPFIAGVANLLISSITNTSISTDNTTLNNSLYYYVVTAVDASANISLQSNWASIQIVPNHATMLISSVTQTEVYLDWVVPARGASSYIIYRDTSNLVSRASGTQFTTSNNKFIDTTAMQGVNYFYVVYSKNDSGFSINPTNIIQASLSALPLPVQWLSLTSSLSDGGFNNGGSIPNEFREFANVNGSSQCNGSNNFPKLTWNSSIPNVKSYVLIVQDLTDGLNFVHFDLYNIPSTTTSISSIASTGTGPKTVNIGFGDTVNNTWFAYTITGAGTFNGNRTGWSGPCPPNDSKTHTYKFKLYALNTTLLPINRQPQADADAFENENGGSGCSNNTPGNASAAGINNVLACDSITGTASYNITLAPSEATNLVASLNNLGNVSLSWVGANGATSYKIFKSTNNIINTNRLANFTTTAPNTSFTDTTAVSGTNYFYTILSNNAGGDATLTSNTISITPQNLVPMITTITAVNTLVTISWTSSYGAQSYNLYRATTNPFIAGVANLLISSITQTSISTDNTTLNNSLYYYVVTAVDASANISLQSNWASIQIVPDQATMLISSVTQTEVYLDWVVPARGASSYVIYRDTSNLVSRASGTQFTTSNNKFIDTTAMQGVNYFYVVYSKNDSGYSINPTNIIQASLSAPVAPPAPATPTVQWLSLTSSLSDGGFNNGGNIPNEFREFANVNGSSQCNGSNNFPKLTWNSSIPNVQSYVLKVQDETDDINFVHFDLFNIPSTTTSIASIASTGTGPKTVNIGFGDTGDNGWANFIFDFPVGSNTNTFDGNTTGWSGPCPPDDNKTHTYRFKLYALSTTLTGGALQPNLDIDLFENLRGGMGCTNNTPGTANGGGVHIVLACDSITGTARH